MLKLQIYRVSLLSLMVIGFITFLSYNSYAVSTSSTDISPPTVTAKDQYLQILGNNTISFTSGTGNARTQCNANQVLTGVGESSPAYGYVQYCASVKTEDDCSWGDCTYWPVCSSYGYHQYLVSDAVRFQCTNVTYPWENLGQNPN